MHILWYLSCDFMHWQKGSLQHKYKLLLSVVNIEYSIKNLNLKIILLRQSF